MTPREGEDGPRTPGEDDPVLELMDGEEPTDGHGNPGVMSEPPGQVTVDAPGVGLPGEGVTLLPCCAAGELGTVYGAVEEPGDVLSCA